MKRLAILSTFVLLMGFSAVAQAATFTLVNDYLGDFYNSATLVENFEDATLLTGLSIQEFGNTGMIEAGVYKNIVDADTGKYQIFNYAYGMTGFGAWLDLASIRGAGGPGSSIDIYADNQFVMNVPNTALGEFYGFLSDTTFTQVMFVEGTDPTGFQETYIGVDLAINRAPVPLPGAAYLLGSGLLGLLGLKRRKSVA